MQHTVCFLVRDSCLQAPGHKHSVGLGNNIGVEVFVEQGIGPTVPRSIKGVLIELL